MTRRSPSAPSRADPRGGGDLHRLLVETVRDYAIFALDPQGYILSWNAGAQRFKGYEADEIIGKHFSIFYPQERIDEGLPDFELKEAARTGRFEDEGWRLRKDGSRFWANVVITALRDSSGKLVAYAKVTRDLTERRRAEERAIEDARRVASEEAARRAAEERADELRGLADQLRRQAEELELRSREAERANRVKSEFLAAMSHELRTPLNAIAGYVQLLQMEIPGPLTDQQQDHLRRVKRSQQYLLGIINDILNFSRAEAGQLTYDIGAVPLERAVEAVAQMIAPQAAAKGVELEACDSHGLVARADAAKVEQILLNLLSNAVKFTAAGGSIAIACEARGDRVAVVVRDTGVGIPAEQLDSIFEPFVQLGRSLTSASEGAGLGLAISRDLARGMAGDLGAASEVGSGSAFTLTLPRERQAEAQGSADERDRA